MQIEAPQFIMERSSVFTVGLIGLLVYGLFRLLSIGKRPEDYPPGPPTLPIIGNIHQVSSPFSCHKMELTRIQMPTKDAHLQFQKWAEEYGDIYSLMLGTQTLIVLSSDVAIKDLMDKRSSNYSDRPELYIGQTLCSDDLRVLMMGYSPKWRSMRKMFHHLLNATVAGDFVPYQTLENKQMLNDLLESPNDFLQHIRRYSNALTTSMVFGWRTPTFNDPDIQQLFEGFSEFAGSLLPRTVCARLLILSRYQYDRRSSSARCFPNHSKATRLHPSTTEESKRPSQS